MPPINMFSLETLKKHRALQPMIAICVAGCALSAGYITYMVLTKPDLSFRPWSWNTESAPYQQVKAKEFRRLVPHKRTVVVDPEIEALKRELGSYRS